MSTSTFLAIDRGRAHWGVHARIVRNVIAVREWAGGEPFDVANVLGLEADAERAERPVLLLGSDGDALPFRAFGKLVFRQLDLSLVQPIPTIVRSLEKRQLVSGVVFDESGPPLVVLDPVALLSMAKGI